ncbi:hypothetical protein [Streptomyces sp. NPDC048411]|uniref:hypothetical protein n=1 Tax=Streptomyces sp. NPDC048411 TaxID=3157206 RepID=UPI003453032D
MSTRPTNALSAAVAVLASLVARFPDLLAADARVSPIVPNRLELSFHNTLGSFEAWRSALDISPGLVRREKECSGPLMWLRTEKTIDGVTVELVGSGYVLADHAEEAETTPAGSAVTA